MSIDDYNFVIRTNNLVKFWTCHQDNPVTTDSLELYDSELRFTPSIKNADLEYNSPVLTDMIAFAEYMIIQTEAKQEEFPYLKAIILDWLEAVYVEYDINPITLRYFFTGKGFDIYLPTKIFGMVAASKLNHQFSRMIDLLSLGYDVAKYINKRPPNYLLYTQVPNSWNPESDCYIIEVTYYEMNKLSISELAFLSKSRRTNFKRKIIQPKVSRELSLLWQGLTQNLQEPNQLKVRFVLERTKSDSDMDMLYVQDMIGAGYSIEEAELELLRWRQSNRPELSELHWLRAFVRGRDFDRSPDAKKFVWLTVVDLMNELGLNNQELRGLITMFFRTADGSQVQSGIFVSRGQLVLSLADLADEAPISRSQARTLVEKLKLNKIIKTEVLGNNKGQLVTWRREMVDMLFL